MTEAILVLIAATSTCGAVALVIDDYRTRSLAARAIVVVAGLVYRPRRLEFRGELSMLQTLPAETGLDYAIGALLGASVERVTSVARPLRIENVSVSYGNVVGIRGISFEVPVGSITALLGGTGSGKTTLLKLLDGRHPHDGSITFDDQPLEPSRRGGISVIHSDLGLFGDFTVAENLCFTQPGRWFLGPRHVEHASWALEQLGAAIDPNRKIKDLQPIQRLQVSLAKALLDGAKLVVLDEPTETLAPSSIDQLLHALRELRRRGIGILFVSHRVDDVFRIADRVAVLHDGALVHDSATADTTPERVVHHIVAGAANESDR